MQTHSQSLSCSRIYSPQTDVLTKNSGRFANRAAASGVLKRNQIAPKPAQTFSWSTHSWRKTITSGLISRTPPCKMSINQQQQQKTTQNIFVCNLFCCSCHLQTVGEEISKETIIDIEFDRMTLRISTAWIPRWKRREWRILESLQSFIFASLSTFWFDFDVDQKIALIIDSSPKNNKTFQ